MTFARVRESPPGGGKVTFALTFLWPVWLSFRRADPVGFTLRPTRPAAFGCLTIFFRFFPARRSLPGPGIETLSVAVPFFLCSFTPRNWKLLDGRRVVKL